MLSKLQRPSPYGNKPLSPKSQRIVELELMLLTGSATPASLQLGEHSTPGASSSGLRRGNVPPYAFGNAAVQIAPKAAQISTATSSRVNVANNPFGPPASQASQVPFVLGAASQVDPAVNEINNLFGAADANAANNPFGAPIPNAANNPMVAGAAGRQIPISQVTTHTGGSADSDELTPLGIGHDDDDLNQDEGGVPLLGLPDTPEDDDSPQTHPERYVRLPPVIPEKDVPQAFKDMDICGGEDVALMYWFYSHLVQDPEYAKYSQKFDFVFNTGRKLIKEIFGKKAHLDQEDKCLTQKQRQQLFTEMKVKSMVEWIDHKMLDSDTANLSKWDKLMILKNASLELRNGDTTNTKKFAEKAFKKLVEKNKRPLSKYCTWDILEETAAWYQRQEVDEVCSPKSKNDQEDEYRY